jgi:hypothetical protein
MKIWSMPHSDMGADMNYNRQALLAVSKLGYVLEHPSIRRYSFVSHPVLRVVT